MVSRNYSDLTIKKLYALSGNVCSFPECNQELISENKTNLSDICHIEGGEEDSPRYNSNLTLTQLNDYGNLIVMCKNHNKYIDDNKKDFSVEHLKEIKQKHEESMRDRNYQIPDDVADKIIREAKNAQVNIQTGTGTQIVSQGEHNVQNIGITSVFEIEHLVEILFKKNFPQLQGISEKTALESAEKYWKKLTEKSKSRLSAEDIKKFAEPDVQYMLTKTVIEAGRKDDDELRENLSSLMVDRIKNSEHNLKRLVYNEAIETLPKLTQDELKIITLCFILKYAKWNNVVTLEDLEKNIIRLKPLINFNNTNAEFQHIAYTGCGESGIGSWSYSKIVQDAYPELSNMTIPEGQLSIHHIPEYVKNELFEKSGDSAYEFKITEKRQLEDYLNSKNLETVTKNSILTEFDQAKNRAVQSTADLLNSLQPIQEITTLISDSTLKHLSLTSVGIVIGAMYYEGITNEKIDIDIWIN